MEVPQGGSGLCPPRVSRDTIQAANCALREEDNLRARKTKGSVVYNKSRATWNYLFMESGKRKSRKLGTLSDLPTKADAIRKAEVVNREMRLVAERLVPTVEQLVEGYKAEQHA